MSAATGRPHASYLFDCSSDMEYLEIVSPADVKSKCIDVEPVCAIPAPTPWKPRHPGQYVLSRAALARVTGGAFYLFVNCAGLIGRTTPRGQARRIDVDVAPPFRMSIATGLEVIEEGCRRIASAVSALHA